MTSEPIRSEGDELNALRKENALLHERLAKAKFEAELYRRTVYKIYNEINPYEPLTADEIHEMLHGPRGRSPLQVLEDFEKKLVRGSV